MPTKITGPNAEYRLNRVYPQESSSIVTDVNFVYRVQSEFPWRVASGNGVVVVSTITEGV